MKLSSNPRIRIEIQLEEFVCGPPTPAPLTFPLICRIDRRAGVSRGDVIDRPPRYPTEDSLDRRHPDARPRIDVPRVLLVGLIAGGIWTFLSIGLLSLVGGHLLASMPGSRVGPGGGPVGLVLVVLNVVIAIWATWLYAALRPAFGPGPRAALVAGLGWWAIATLQSSKWVAAVVDPWTAAIPTAAMTLPAALTTMFAVGWIYERR